MKIDTHVHTRNSADGRDSISEICRQAVEKGISFLCTTDHLDYDLKYGGHAAVPWKHIDLDEYKAEWLEAKEALGEDSGLELRFGIEAGWSKNAEKHLEELLPRYDFDQVINSVHFVLGWDVYFPQAFWFKPKKRLYSQYLKNVLESLDAPYQYDVVAHFGYVTRNAPYKDKSLNYSDYPELFDKILLKVIEKGKALEINTHKTWYPTDEILRRYYALGGRKISFGSDSHRGQLCEDYEKVCAYLLDIGFTHFSVFRKHVESLVEIPRF
ncbi:MAG: histidinol-phosphatase HisJ family protein [Clostridia bacterium]|nr:histidinol-phosphatase HisJ family protein [Clostridia bacterium]